MELNGQKVEHVYFPHTGVISLVVEMKVGDMIKTAMVGRYGVVNGTSALDGKISLRKGIPHKEPGTHPMRRVLVLGRSF